MTVWFVAAIPPLIMFFALAMERLETRLRHVAMHDNAAVQEKEVQEFLQTARADEVRALFRSGIGRALELFQGRRLRRVALIRSRRPRQRS